MNLSDLKQHQAISQFRYGTNANRQIVNLLEKAERRINSRLRDQIEGLTQREIADLLANKYSTRRLVALRESIRELAAVAREELRDGIKSFGTELAGEEIDNTRALLTALGHSELGSTVTATQAYAAAVSRPMLGKHVRDHIKELEPRYISLFFSAIREGFVNGESTGVIVRRITGTQALRNRDGLLFTRKTSIERIVRTSLNHIANVANERAMVEAEVDKYQYLATLDFRTSAVCRSLDLEVFDVDSNSPRPPQHPNCRSTTIPYLGSPTGGLRPSVADDRPVSEIPKSEREEKIGRVSGDTSYGKWLKRQSKSDQRDYLGATRFKLFDEGKLSLDRFVDKTGKQLNIDQLRQRNRELFQRLDI